MELNIKNNKIEVCQLQIDKKQLTKTRLFSLPMHSYIETLELLLKEEIEIVARFPFDLYAESAQKRDKLLGITSDQPPPDFFSKSSGYSLVGVLLYDPKVNALSKSWFTANEFITPEMNNLNKLYNKLTVTQGDLLSLNEFSVVDVVNLFEDVRIDHITHIDKNFSLYLEICNTAKHQLIWGGMDDADFLLPRGRPRRNPEPSDTMTEEETQSWFDSSGEDKLLGFDTFLNPNWLSRFLMSPFTLPNWSETKSWLDINLQHQICSVEDRITPCNIAYDSVMDKFEKAPIILI